MDRDWRDTDDADWLLAQLASGRPARQDSPVAPPSPSGSVTPSPATESIAEHNSPPMLQPPAPQPAVTSTPAPRGEEVLDWFSLAEPEGEPDPVTRALPVIDAQAPRVEPAVAPAPPAAPAAPAAPPVIPAASVPPVPPTPAPVPPPAQAAPVQPEPVGDPIPPGPVTPPAPFALTWGNGDLDSEEAIRTAFRSLSTSGLASEPPARSDAPSAPIDAESIAPPSESTPSEPTVPDAVAAPPAPAASVPDPFAEFTPPPVARQSFTPVARQTPIPPQHPIAPTTAPPSWEERAAARRRAPAGFDDELWSALNDEVAPSAAPAPPLRPAEVEPPTTAVPLPSAAMPAPVAPAPVPPAESAPTAAPAPTLPPTAPFEMPFRPADASARGEAPQPKGFPLVEVRGQTGWPVPTHGAGAEAATGAEAAADRRAPFPAFAASGGGDWPDRRDPQPSEPVDDLLAALGGGTRPTSDDRSGETPGAGNGGGLPPRRDALPPEEPPTPDEPGVDVFGFGFDEVDSGADDQGSDDGSDGEADSPIARELAETGYFWNLTPDPTAPDPKAEPPAESSVPSPSAQPSPFAVEHDVAPEPAWEPEPAWKAEPASEPEPAWPGGPQDEEWPPPAPAVGQPQPEPREQPERSFGDDLDRVFAAAARPAEPVAPAGSLPTPSATDDDPLASLFGAAAQHATPDPWSSAGAPWPPAAAASPTAFAAAPAGTALPARPPAVAPVPGGAGRGSGPSVGSGGSGGAGGSRAVRTLGWIAGGLVLAVILAGLFYLGTRLSGGGGEAQAPSAAPSDTPTPVAEPTAPQPVGVHAWNTLFGGECIEPFESAWAEEFTVVDCAAPHAAQLVYRGELPGDAAAPFPGEEAIASEMNLRCSAPGIIDVGLVPGMPDLQVQAAFPVTEEQWTGGERTYYCFANRAGGEPLTGSIQGPGPSA